MMRKLDQSFPKSFLVYAICKIKKYMHRPQDLIQKADEYHSNGIKLLKRMKKIDSSIDKEVNVFIENAIKIQESILAMKDLEQKINSFISTYRSKNTPNRYQLSILKIIWDKVLFDSKIANHKLKVKNIDIRLQNIKYLHDKRLNK